jgi:hypothetical protein
MINLRLLRELMLRVPPQPGRPAHLGAASGLVRLGASLYVVGDDENHLGVFPASGTQPGELLRLIDGELPPDPRDRKKLKRDFEALVRLPPAGDLPYGALLALGSGSKKRRRTGIVLSLDAGLAPVGTRRSINMQPLYEELASHVDDLNIEGATVLGDDFVILLRGNDGAARNACVYYALQDVLDALARSSTMAALPPREIVPVDLGRRHGVTLGITDGVGLPDGSLLFSAVAERTDDSYLDGECVGAVVGLLDRRGVLLNMEDVSPTVKIEGVDAELTPEGVRFLAVTDADDPAVAGKLLEGVWMKREIF